MKTLTPADKIIRDGADLVVALAVPTAEVGGTLANSTNTLPDSAALRGRGAVHSVLPEAVNMQTSAAWREVTPSAVCGHETHVV